MDIYPELFVILEENLNECAQTTVKHRGMTQTDEPLPTFVAVFQKTIFWRDLQTSPHPSKSRIPPSKIYTTLQNNSIWEAATEQHQTKMLYFWYVMRCQSPACTWLL